MRRLFRYMRRIGWRYAFGIFCTFTDGHARDGCSDIWRATRSMPRSRAISTRNSVPIAELICAARALMGDRALDFALRDLQLRARRRVRNPQRPLRPSGAARPRFLSSGFKTGDLMSRMINDLTAVRMMVGMGVLTITNTPLYFVYALIFMLSLNPRLTLATIVPCDLAALRDVQAHALADGAQPEGPGRNSARSAPRCRKALPEFTSSRPTRSRITTRSSFASSTTTTTNRVSRSRGCAARLFPMIRAVGGDLDDDRPDLWRPLVMAPRCRSAI